MIPKNVSVREDSGYVRSALTLQELQAEARPVVRPLTSNLWELYGGFKEPKIATWLPEVWT